MLLGVTPNFSFKQNRFLQQRSFMVAHLHVFDPRVTRHRFSSTLHFRANLFGFNKLRPPITSCTGIYLEPRQVDQTRGQRKHSSGGEHALGVRSRRYK